MIISSKNQFHSLVTSLRDLLSKKDVSIKTSRVQELFSRSLGYKSANGLLANLPVDIRLTEKIFSSFREQLKERHCVDTIDTSWLLRHLESQHKNYSAVWGSDSKCYPKKLLPTENYWYLTKDGWIPWSKMDFSRMRAELNIYKVVHSHFSPFLGEGSFTGSARPIWTADIASCDFQSDAHKLEKKFGDMPESERMFSMS